VDGYIPTRGGEKRGGGSSMASSSSTRTIFCLVADWSQPYVMLEAARQQGREDLDGTPTTHAHQGLY
jgi:hypothetical protein